MLAIPLQAVPNQTLAVALSGRSVQLNVYLRGSDMFIDVFLSGVTIIRGVICQNLNRIVRDLYLRLPWRLRIFSTPQGSDDPVYTGFGTASNSSISSQANCRRASDDVSASTPRRLDHARNRHLRWIEQQPRPL
jgi:hypothetical protein